MELTQRKKQILKIVVDSYINTAEPVGSKAIVALMPEKVSSATVRNELADLTDMGYLEQPHTSAGRIPPCRLAISVTNTCTTARTKTAGSICSGNSSVYCQPSAYRVDTSPGGVPIRSPGLIHTCTFPCQ